MDRQVFDRMAEQDSTHWWFVARRRILETLIRRSVRPPAGARILEIGCGTGHNLEMLSQFGSVEASELDDAARAIASRRTQSVIRKAALPDLDEFPAESFDMIALLDVLEHVDDDRAALAAIRTRLKPGGKLLVTVPANPWMWSAHDVEHHHHRRYRKSQLKAVAEQSGFKVEVLSPFNTVLFPLIAGVRLAAKITRRETADDSMPPAPVNRVLRSLFASEAAFIGRVPFPFGVSLAAVLSRPA